MQTNKYSIAAVVAVMAIFGAIYSWIGVGREELMPTIKRQEIIVKDFVGKTFRLLIVGDPFATALQLSIDELSRRSGAKIEVEVAGYSDVRKLTLQNARDSQSLYDVVSFDVVWLGAYMNAHVLSPVKTDIDINLHPEDYLQPAFEQTKIGSKIYGLPIQPHPELLWVRSDLLDRHGLKAPSTTDELITAAKKMTNKHNGVYGLCWNGQRGQALGQQMAHFYSAFGQPLLSETGVPTLNTPKGLAAANFAKALLAFAPSDILSMAWDQRARSFARGSCAMTYEWGARSYIAESDPLSVVKGKVGYFPAPHAPYAKPVTPLGTWSLGVPFNLGSKHADAEKFLLWISEPEQQLLIARNGNGGMPRMTLLRNPELVKLYPAYPIVEQLAKQSGLSDWMRPPIPQWPDLSEILGTVFHDMLEGRLSPEEAIQLAQKKATMLFSINNKRIEK